MKKEITTAILGYLCILGLSVVVGFFVNTAVTVAKHIHLISDNQVLVIFVIMLFLIGPVAEETSKMLALHRANVKFYPLIIGGIEFVQYLILCNANVFVRVAAWAMHVGTGEIHRRYRQKPIKGLLWAIAAHQTYNMLAVLLSALYIKYLL